ncbi:MAG: hypothetical protein A3E36_04780 [Candidatus Andersenbacteria bacterium RIFCSPHIGHO2_12_FULL_45_11b]|uniref:Uncharacterized protein n=1 Tax=Candidatus Andersenbacteria bacterium RIFCSPHIGHO2_12_FULL_45_11b TaxID=1797282 RepID=A0A1G1XC81_9BACT|nr:MAG: hypothetical protein A3E36_04780 [Candidatus Andersenbacteria bacterium RIFCSPHIGHO2_12_FULL_45_11b]
MVVGEYVADQGFPLPNPVSVYPEYCRSRFAIVRFTQKLLKNEDTWYEVLGHVEMPKTKKAECEYSRGDMIEMALHIRGDLQPVE